MLFKASTYLQIGGHRALAAEVVEDLALARAIKAGGHRLRYLLGLDAVDLRMYPTSRLFGRAGRFLGLTGTLSKPSEPPWWWW